MFQFILADYSYSEIEKAFIFYLKNNRDMPAPADIACIIDRGGKPPFDRAVYVSVSKKQPEDRTDDDWKYMKDYERYMI